MNNNTKINKTTQDKVKMRKLIVEAPELKEGQKDSSGGIRENGKIAVQYKNPVPLPPTTHQRSYTRKDMLKDQVKDFAIGVGTDLISMIWSEYGKPFIRTKLQQLGQRAIAYPAPPAKASPVSTKQDVKSSHNIDVEFEDTLETDGLNDNDKIIRFPNHRVS